METGDCFSPIYTKCVLKHALPWQQDNLKLEKDFSCVHRCRYTAVAMPMLYNTRYSSRRRVAVMIAVVWFLSFAISCPLLFGLNNTGNSCIWSSAVLTSQQRLRSECSFIYSYIRYSFRIEVWCCSSRNLQVAAQSSGSGHFCKRELRSQQGFISLNKG